MLMTHEPRLTQALRMLLQTSRVAALGTSHADGTPFVSMVPFAVAVDIPAIVIHVSGLAPHTRNLQNSSAVSLLVMQAEIAGEGVHALPRVSLDGIARVLAVESTDWAFARHAYLARFPEAEPMTELGDFMFVAIEIKLARQVAGFGAARTLEAEAVLQVLQPAA